MLSPVVALHRPSILGPGLFTLALTGCFDDPPSVVESEASSDAGTTTAGPSSGPTTTPPDDTTGGGTTEDETGPTPTTGSMDTTTGPEDTGSTSETSSECEAEDGLPDPRCAPATPFCVGGSCVPCSGGGDCQALDPNTPVCGADDVCRPCTAHSECSNDAGCHLFEGTCLPADNVYYVDPSGNCNPGDATEMMPACSIGQAFAAIGARTEATVRLAEDVYLEGVDVDAGRVIAMIATGETTIFANTDQASVHNLGTLYLDTIDVQNFSVLGSGIESDGDLWLDDSMVRNNETGLLSVSGRVVLRRSRVIDSPGVGVILQGDQPVLLLNSIVAYNGETSDPAGIVTYGPAPLDIVYSTIVENTGNTGGAIDCGPGSATVRNSIVTSSTFSNAIDCGGATTVTYSVVSDAQFDGDPTNVPVADFAPLAMNDDFEIAAGSLAIDVAQWQVGDPPTDIGGAPRPAMDGAPDDAGADRAD